MRRIILCGLAGATAASLCFASAATLGGLHSGVLGAGGASVVACDTNGVTVDYTTVGGNVTTATVGGIADPACEGSELSITLTNAGTKIGGGGPQAVASDGDTADNSMSIPISPQPAAEQVDGVHVSITGP